MSLDEQLKSMLIKCVDDAIEFGLAHQSPMPINLQDYPRALQEPGASFITLEINGQLRGCIGSLIAHRSLIEDVSLNAQAAAFSDPRFGPLTTAEWPAVDKHISTLSQPTPISFTSEADLISQIRMGIDGLILTEGTNRGTFLPSVWEQVPDAVQFLRHLKNKAGLPSDYWSDTIQIERYTTEIF